MHAREAHFELARLLSKPGPFAVIFFLTSVTLMTCGLGSAWLINSLIGNAPAWNRIAFIVSFAVSTGLLVTGSVQLVRASAFVKVERQPQFRRCLIRALAAGTAFVGVQTYGLQSLMTLRSVDIGTGLKHAAFAFILLHAVHVVVALLFLVHIFLKAIADRYDHEYSWGVTFCGWFWHGLGVIWLAIMAVFTVAGSAAMVT